MRLVDADEAYKVLTDYYHQRTEIQHKALKEAIERVPTVDAVEVVRCKDCMYRDGNVCDYSAVYVRPHGYCQWGRREEDDNH